jgi:hypothetical protein
VLGLPKGPKLEADHKGRGLTLHTASALAPGPEQADTIVAASGFSTVLLTLTLDGVRCHFQWQALPLLSPLQDLFKGWAHRR